MIDSRYAEGTVSANKHWTDHLCSLRIEAEIQPFTAGQFGKLALEIDGERIARPYSYVNPPQDPMLEFYLIVVPDGPLSSRLAVLEPGDKVQVAKASTGFLVLDEVPKGRYLWMVSTGTGVGPFLSILNTPLPWQRFEKIILVHAVRHAEELSYRELIGRIQKQYPQQFRAIYFVSREKTDFALPGRIPAAIKTGRLEKRAGCTLQPEDSQVMLCGNPDMVKDTTEILLSRGLSKNRRRTPGHITVEAYW